MKDNPMMRNLLFAGAAVVALAACDGVYGVTPVPLASTPAPPPFQPVAAAPGIPLNLNNDGVGNSTTAPLDLGPVNPPPAPVHPRRQYRQPPVTEQPDDEPPVADLPPQPAPPQPNDTPAPTPQPAPSPRVSPPNLGTGGEQPAPQVWRSPADSCGWWDPCVLWR